MQVKLAERFERFWGPTAARHLCVSKAMQAELLQSWRIRATVFYDRPPAHFRPTPLKQQVAWPSMYMPLSRYPPGYHCCAAQVASQNGTTPC